ncbi:MAG: YoaP domain-containing protein [Bacteroidia bacterium]|nr:YoaP domain-containing protein [Bacteroidia bacterium]NNL81715.1 hypothetical protein [Flavobacteriaceae bacterium]
MSKEHSENIIIKNVTEENISDLGVFCIKNKKAEGYKVKKDWFCSARNKGVRIKIAFDQDGKQLGFIEYLPSEIAWRPIKARNYIFIQCIAMFSKSTRDKGTASRMIQEIEKEAMAENKFGLCTMSSNGSWMANKTLFLKNGFNILEKKGRFELLGKSFNGNSEKPELLDWTQEQSAFKGWHLLYANQCPWHIKSVTDLQSTAKEYSIDLKVKELDSPSQAQQAPSGYGTFSLIKDGKLLADHYISKTRFKTILKQELQS